MNSDNHNSDLSQAREFAKENNLPDLQGASAENIELAEIARWKDLRQEFNLLKSMENTFQYDQEERALHPHLHEDDPLEVTQEQIDEQKDKIGEISSKTDSSYWLQWNTKLNTIGEMQGLKANITTLEKRLIAFPNEKEKLEPEIRRMKQKLKDLKDLYYGSSDNQEEYSS